MWNNSSAAEVTEAMAGADWEENSYYKKSRNSTPNHECLLGDMKET
jgi:hypothetical protein